MVNPICEHWGDSLPVSASERRIGGKRWYVAVGIAQAHTFKPGTQGEVVIPVNEIDGLTDEQIGQNVRQLVGHAQAIFAVCLANDMLEHRAQIFKDYRDHNNDVIDIEDYIKPFAESPDIHLSDRETIKKALRMVSQFITHVDRKEKGKTTKRYERAAAAKDFDALFVAVGRRDGFKCAACASVDNLQLDHIEPVALGGETHPNNLQLLCKPCNLRKGEQTIDYRGTQHEEGGIQ